MSRHEFPRDAQIENLERQLAECKCVCGAQAKALAKVRTFINECDLDAATRGMTNDEYNTFLNGFERVEIAIRELVEEIAMAQDALKLANGDVK